MAAVTFAQKIQGVVHALDEGRLVGDQLQVVSRWRWRWFVSLLFWPVCYVIGYDLFPHVRAHRVAQKILQECQAHQKELTPELMKAIQYDILNRLNRKTKNRYQKALDDVWNNLQKFYFEPPKASIPQPLHVHWPQDERIKVSVEEKAHINRFLTEQEQGLSLMRKGIKHVMHGGTWTLPVTLRLFYHQDKLVQALAMTNSKKGPLIGKGGQRQVKSCVDLTNGKLAVKKRASPYETDFVHALMGKQRQGYNGIPQFIATFFPDRTVPQKNKFSLVEKLYDGTLDDFLETPALETLSSKMEVFDQLLSFMEALSQIDPSLGKYMVPSGARSFHHDIKTLNILCSRRDGSLEVVMADYGASNWFAVILISVYYASPETMQFRQMVKPYDYAKIEQFNAKFGPGRDVWSLGVVLAQVLLNSKKVFEAISSRYSIEETPSDNALDEWYWVPDDPDHQRGKLDRLGLEQRINKKLRCEPILRDQLEFELTKAKGTAKGPDQFILTKMWDLVIQMLQYDPAQRITIQHAREMWMHILKMKTI